MLSLMVSYDCGMTYGLDTSAETKEELLPRMQELDQEMLRWYVDRDGKQVFDDDCICKIYRGILGLFA